MSWLRTTTFLSCRKSVGVTGFSGVSSAPVGPPGLGYAPWLIPMAADGLSERASGSGNQTVLAPLPLLASSGASDSVLTESHKMLFSGMKTETSGLSKPSLGA